jgi:cardiolipin synthase (CMP-forming)
MIARQLPNAITLCRIALALPIAMLIRAGDYRLALLWLLLAAMTDVLDGFLARRFGWQTPLGGMLDPLADKLLLAACFVGLWQAQAVPGWLLLLVLGRDLVIVAGALLYRALIGPVAAAPTLAGKINTALQILFVLGWLLRLAGAPLAPALLSIATIAVAALTIASGIDYVWRWSARALQAGGGSGR